MAAPVASAKNIPHKLQDHNENDEAQKAAPNPVAVPAAIAAPTTKTVKHRHLSFLAFSIFAYLQWPFHPPNNPPSRAIAMIGTSMP